MDDLTRLLERFEFRPLSTRSLLLSLLLGTHPPELSAERLVAFGERFGIRPGTVRTTLSRMVANGDLTTSDADYRLSERLTGRQREQDLGQRADDDARDRWDGTWWTAIVVGSERSMTDRRHFRAAMVGARMGELRPDIWMRPANLPAPDDASIVVTRGDLVMGDAVDLCDRLWDVDRLERAAAELSDGLDTLDELLAADHRHLPLAFDVSAVCVRFLRAEPRLPAALVAMPACRRLRSTYGPFNRRFLHVLDASS